MGYEKDTKAVKLSKEQLRQQMQKKQNDGMLQYALAMGDTHKRTTATMDVFEELQQKHKGLATAKGVSSINAYRHRTISTGYGKCRDNTMAASGAWSQADEAAQLIVDMHEVYEPRVLERYSVSLVMAMIKFREGQAKVDMYVVHRVPGSLQPRISIKLKAEQMDNAAKLASLSVDTIHETLKAMYPSELREDDVVEEGLGSADSPPPKAKCTLEPDMITNVLRAFESFGLWAATREMTKGDANMKLGVMATLEKEGFGLLVSVNDMMISKTQTPFREGSVVQNPDRNAKIEIFLKPPFALKLADTRDALCRLGVADSKLLGFNSSSVAHPYDSSNRNSREKVWKSLRVLLSLAVACGAGDLLLTSSESEVAKVARELYYFSTVNENAASAPYKAMQAFYKDPDKVGAFAKILWNMACKVKGKPELALRLDAAIHDDLFCPLPALDDATGAAGVLDAEAFAGHPLSSQNAEDDDDFDATPAQPLARAVGRAGGRAGGSGGAGAGVDLLSLPNTP